MRARRALQAGFSMVEMAIAMVATVILVGMISFSMQSTFDTWQGTVTGTELERNASYAMDRMVAAVADAGLTTIADDLAPPSGGSSVSFQARRGYTAGAVDWGPVTTLAWVSDPDDPRDDVDNDGDGVVDEGQVVLSDATGNSTVLVRHVTEYLAGESDGGGDDNGNGLEDEQGLSLELDGSRLHIRLTLSRRGADGEIVTRSAESIVRLLE